MELNTELVIIFLLGLVQAWFFWDKQRNAEELKVLRESIKETRIAMQRIEGILTSLEKQIAVANYALFKERSGGGDD